MLRAFSICLIAVAVIGMPADDAFAAKKKKGKKGLGTRDQYTSEQREAIYKEAIKSCRKKFGSTAYARVNYAQRSVLCWIQ